MRSCLYDVRTSKHGIVVVGTLGMHSRPSKDSVPFISLPYLKNMPYRTMATDTAWPRVPKHKQNPREATCALIAYWPLMHSYSNSPTIEYNAMGAAIHNMCILAFPSSPLSVKNPPHKSGEGSDRTKFKYGESLSTLFALQITPRSFTVRTTSTVHVSTAFWSPG